MFSEPEPATVNILLETAVVPDFHRNLMKSAGGGKFPVRGLRPLPAQRRVRSIRPSPLKLAAQHPPLQPTETNQSLCGHRRAVMLM